MAYPRRCPLYGADYRPPIRGRAPAGVVSDLRHATVAAAPGGTPGPGRPELPGRLLTLRCLVCRGEYAWDYFAGGVNGDRASPFGEGLPAREEPPT